MRRTVSLLGTTSSFMFRGLFSILLELNFLNLLLDCFLYLFYVKLQILFPPFGRMLLQKLKQTLGCFEPSLILVLLIILILRRPIIFMHGIFLLCLPIIYAIIILAIDCVVLSLLVLVQNNFFIRLAV